MFENLTLQFEMEGKGLNKIMGKIFEENTQQKMLSSQIVILVMWLKILAMSIFLKLLLFVQADETLNLSFISCG